MSTFSMLVVAMMPAIAWANGGPPSLAAGSTSLGCADDAWVATPVGRISNNTWNKRAAGGFAWRQCLLKRESADGEQYGWAWRWPEPGSAVYAYPETVIGVKPWDPGSNNDARFPKQVSATRRLLVAYDVETEATGDHNLAASIWLVRTPTVTRSSIATEIMVWTESTPERVVPAGTRRAEVRIDDRDWEVWSADHWGDASGAHANRWTYIVYRAKQPTRTITFDARKMMADAIARGWMSDDLYIANVELGNEIFSGSGSTFIKSLTVTID